MQDDGLMPGNRYGAFLMPVFQTFGTHEDRSILLPVFFCACKGERQMQKKSSQAIRGP